MRVSALFGQTLRHVSQANESISHQLLLRAGYIRQLSTGIYAYLPLAYRSLKKVETILKEEMNNIGGQQLSMPLEQPNELSKEGIATITRHEISSYKQLPRLLYQIKNSRTITMKDSYSLDLNQEGLNKQYKAHSQAYFRIAKRLGLSIVSVKSDSEIHAHEWMYLHPNGKENVVICENCDDAANQNVARFTPTTLFQDKPLAIEEVYTPQTKTIDELAKYLQIKPEQCAKSIFFMAEHDQQEPQLILAIVRGDMEVNEQKILKLTRAKSLRTATTEEIEKIGSVTGYASPINIHREHVIIIVDHIIQHSNNVVMGANKKDYHLRHVCYGRDYQSDIDESIALPPKDALCVKCQNPLKIMPGIQVGKMVQLGTLYSEAMNLTYLDSHGKAQAIFWGSYHIEISQLLTCIAEDYHDKDGLIWPISVAPFEIYLMTIGTRESTLTYAEKLYEQLSNLGIEVLYDDRSAKAGVKFKDADLRGIPLRVTLSDRNLEQGVIELKIRNERDKLLVEQEQIIETIQKKIKDLYEKLSSSKITSCTG